MGNSLTRSADGIERSSPTGHLSEGVDPRLKAADFVQRANGVRTIRDSGKLMHTRSSAHS